MKNIFNFYFFKFKPFQAISIKLETAKNLEQAEQITSLKTEKSKESLFRELTEKYQRRVYAHIRKMVVTHEDADDLTQETFVKVWKNLDGFRQESEVFTWIYRIATNEALQFLRRKKIRKFFRYEKVGKELAELAENQRYCDGEEWNKELFQLVQHLPEKQKAVFCMRYYDDLPYKEISEILGTSEGGLKASYHHAVKKLETELKQKIC